MVVSLATLILGDARLALWLLSNPLPHAIAHPDKSVGIRLTGADATDIIIPWPMVHGADTRDKDGVPAIDSTQRRRGARQAAPKRLPPPKDHA